MDGFCGWYDSDCQRPRSCFDCLHYANTTACGINVNNGACVAVPTNGSTAVTTTPTARYCSDEDSSCADCRRRWIGLALSSASARVILRGETCTGVGGCLCMALCHDSQRAVAVRSQSEWCTAVPVMATSSPVPVQALKFAFEGTTEFETIAFLGSIIVVPILLLICCCWGCVRCVNSSQRLPPVIARRHETDPNDPEVVYAPYTTVAGYVDLNAVVVGPHAQVNRAE